MAQSERANAYISANIAMMAFSFVIVSLRLYCRVWLSKRRLWWDDLFVVTAFLFAVGHGATINIAMSHYGWDMHAWDMPLDRLEESTRAYLMIKSFFVLSTTSTRTSLLLFYIWIVKDMVGFGFRRVLWAMLGINAFLGLLMFFLGIFKCVPVSASWSLVPPEGSKCLDASLLSLVFGAIMSSLDLAANLAPLRIVAQLQLPLRKRISVSILLSVGGVATIAGIIREIWLYRVYHQTQNASFDTLPLWIVSDVEVYIALICACLPSLRPLWTKTPYVQGPEPQSPSPDMECFIRSPHRRGMFSDLFSQISQDTSSVISYHPNRISVLTDVEKMDMIKESCVAVSEEFEEDDAANMPSRPRPSLPNLFRFSRMVAPRPARLSLAIV